MISFVTLFGSIWLYFDFKEAIASHQKEIHRIEVSRAAKVSKSILSQIIYNTIDDITKIKTDTMLVNHINTLLSYYTNEEFKYVYIVYIDDKNAYRYLADGSQMHERAKINQKFTPSHVSLWNKVLNEKKDVYDIQTSAEGLWLTYLSPIVKNGIIEAILVLDISTQEYKNFSKLLIPLNNFLNIFLVVLVIIFFLTTLQGTLFYKQLKQSLIDPLTKLYNRHYLDDYSVRLNNEDLAIVMIDIDFFKSVNDSYGHDVGDIVISAIARKLIAATRLEDKVIRYGGEEFLILIKSAKTKEDVIKISERIRESIDNEQIRINTQLSVHVTVSLGVNLCEQPFTSLNEEIKYADKMLYSAKHNGRNRVEVYKPSPSLKLPHLPL